MMKKRTESHIVILGAGYAGMAAALRLAHKAKHLPVTITLVNGSGTFVERIRLHQSAAGEQLQQRPIASLLDVAQVHFVRGWVNNLAPYLRRVAVQTDRGTVELDYDYLLYALGSTADKDSIPGVREHALAMGNPSDSSSLREHLREIAAGGGNVLVVGGGLTGIETAAEVAERYPLSQVQLVTAGQIGAGLSEQGRGYIRRAFTRLGVSVQEGLRVDHLEADVAVAVNGRALPFDLCIWAGPMRAQPLARQSGLAVNARGQILIDASMRSVTNPSIYAAGDSAAFVPEAGLATRMACASALPMGAHAADNLYAQLAGTQQEPFRLGYVGQCISLGRRDALIQAVHPDDRATDRIVTGRLAVWLKEGISRAAALAATKSWVARSYTWRKWNTRSGTARDLRPAVTEALK